MHITSPVPIRDRSVARGASGSRAGRTPSLLLLEHSRPVSKLASRIGRMSDPPGAVGHKGSLSNCRGMTVPAGSDAVTGFPSRIAGSNPRRGRNERPAHLPERYRMGIERSWKGLSLPPPSRPPL